ncbi:uncharacterized protein LOC127866600 isoform X3 [Dreissena polymorpha]|uniref:Uncharacterized protein n=1 Tax=Dreissena polymorpha TaxID=45954 RepID=A0A9D4LTP3_DREPO|nr:uncharacterized protein LOC127866600 isoform X3 [Dreissena polymorpha]KAH3863584.1 hypothetical protein DPMN_026572 [Dreissena polymorpha]
MSYHLVKESLSLFDDDLSSQSETVKKKKSTKSPMQLISSKKKGVKKELHRIKKQQKMKSLNSKRNTDKKLPDGLKEAVDFTDMSVQSLCRISKLSAANESVAKVVLKEKTGYKIGEFRWTGGTIPPSTTPSFLNGFQ